MKLIFISRASAIIGFNQIELIGTCGYDYIHHDDLEKIIECHKKCKIFFIFCLCKESVFFI